MTHHHYFFGSGCNLTSHDVASIKIQLTQIITMLTDLSKKETQIMADFTAFNAMMEKIAADVTNVAAEVNTLQTELAAALSVNDQPAIDAATAKLGTLAATLEAIPPALTAATATVASPGSDAAPAATEEVQG